MSSQTPTDPDVIARLIDLDKKITLLAGLPTKVDSTEEFTKQMPYKFGEIQQRLDSQDSEIKNVKRRLDK